MKYLWLVILSGIISAAGSRADNTVVVERNGAGATASFRFAKVPGPARNDAAANASVAIIDGRKDGNSGEPARLHDGRLPTNEDQPAQNFFFAPGTDGGRLQFDLGKSIEIRQINTYSWHASTRGPQVYKLYASDGAGEKFDAQPKRGTDPAAHGWKQLASVDTRPKDGEPGGQYGVSIANSNGAMGTYRYLLFDISRTEDRDAFGNTFYSEIDVVAVNGPAPVAASEMETITRTIEAGDGKYQITIDTSIAPDLTEWAARELAPVVQEWYPKIVQMLPSDNFEAPARITIRFRDDMRGTPASASGDRINCNADWFRRNLKGEARGSVVHEMVHVVQQYGRARRNNPNATRTPGWLVEGIPDYIRWFLYEPEAKGAEITARNLARASHDASYRITGNFLNWVTLKHDREIVRKLNAAAREGKYTEELWKEYTGKPLAELGSDWKREHEQRLATRAAAEENGTGIPATP